MDSRCLLLESVSSKTSRRPGFAYNRCLIMPGSIQLGERCLRLCCNTGLHREVNVNLCMLAAISLLPVHMRCLRLCSMLSMSRSQKTICDECVLPKTGFAEDCVCRRLSIPKTVCAEDYLCKRAFVQKTVCHRAPIPKPSSQKRCSKEHRYVLHCSD